MKKDVIANYVGQFWSAVMNVAFIPVYIAQLGVESFGLIGVLATLQAAFGLLDLGMTPVLGRESARYLSGAHTAFSIRSLFRSVETIVAILAALIVVMIYFASGWIASHWLNSSSLDPSTIAMLLTLMSAIVGLRLFETLYRSALMGLHRQLNLNGGVVVISTLRGVGSVGILVLVSPTIHAYLVWQLICSLMAVAVFGMMAYQALPICKERVAFTTAAIKGVWRFAAGMTVISALAVLLTQSDKIILSKVLPLSQFGTYTLATMVAAIPQMLASPILQALQPRLTRQVAAHEDTAFTASFHAGAQFVSAILGSASMVLIFFSFDIVAIWLGNERVSQSSAILISVLAIGNLLSGSLLTPYLAQMAYGWTGLASRLALACVVVQIALLACLTPRFGALGAAWIWVALNTASFVAVATVMFGRILRGQRRAWLLTDLGQPLGAALCISLAAKWIAPNTATIYSKLAFLVFASSAVLTAAALASPAIRVILSQYVPTERLFRDRLT